MRLKQVIAISIVVFFLNISCLPIVRSNNVKTDTNNQNLEDDIELLLLRGEYYLYLDAIDDVDQFNVRYSFPPELKYQHPIYFEILEDSTAEILDYRIENDVKIPNKFLIFEIGPMIKDERVMIHFNYWVLINNTDYSDLPEYINIPKTNELPQETLKWLSPTSAVQSDRLLIRLRALQMRFLTNNLLKMADRIAYFTRNHRYLLFLIQINLGLYRSQDALTTLFINGECPGRSHLGSALFRANGVPSRVLMAVPSRYKFWFEMHFMTEYYCPGYDWILTEVHGGSTPYEPKNQIIQRICYPEDEEDTQNDFINPKMNFIEKWFWIENEAVKPYYKDLKEGSKTRGYKESEVFTNPLVGNDALKLTIEVFNDFEYYLSLDLFGENKGHFDNATSYQSQAVYTFKGAVDPFGYIYYLNKAREEYDKIDMNVK